MIPPFLPFLFFPQQILLLGYKQQSFNVLTVSVDISKTLTIQQSYYIDLPDIILKQAAAGIQMIDKLLDDSISNG